MSLTSAALVSLLAFLSPLLIRASRLPVPDVVVQILLGVVVGPQVLGWATVDEPVRVLSVIGLSLLLFLAGLEIPFDRLRGPTLRIAAAAFALSFVLALVLGGALGALHLAASPLLLAVILSATALGIVVPILEDGGELDGPVGLVVVAGASLAEVVPVVLLSLLFSGRAGGAGPRSAVLVVFLGSVAAIGAAVVALRRLRWVRQAVAALQDTTAQIRVRAAVALLMALSALAAAFGLEAILGAFLAGATISLLDTDQDIAHPRFRSQLQALGFGALIPFFFVATGMSLDVRSFASGAGTAVRVGAFVIAILVVRGVPALLYRRLLPGRRDVAVAALLQATTLSIPVVGGAIGVSLGLVTAQNQVALVGAGLVSVVAFPVAARALAGGRHGERWSSPGAGRPDASATQGLSHSAGFVDPQRRRPPTWGVTPHL